MYHCVRDGELALNMIRIVEYLKAKYSVSDANTTGNIGNDLSIVCAMPRNAPVNEREKEELHWR